MGNPANGRRCSERRKDGEPCRRRPALGDTACPAHGGRSRAPDIAADPEGAAARLLAEAATASESTASAFLAAVGEWE
jgi:hypothetical protein